MSLCIRYNFHRTNIHNTKKDTGCEKNGFIELENNLRFETSLFSSSFLCMLFASSMVNFKMAAFISVSGVSVKVNLHSILQSFSVF